MSRPDLVVSGAAPSPNHGFEIDLPVVICHRIRHGKHAIRVRAEIYEPVSDTGVLGHNYFRSLHDHTTMFRGTYETHRDIDYMTHSFELAASPRCLCDFKECEC